MNNELANVLNDLGEIKIDNSTQNIMQIPSFFPEQFKCATNMVPRLNLLNNMNNTNKELVKIVSYALFNVFKTAGFIKKG